MSNTLKGAGGADFVAAAAAMMSPPKYLTHTTAGGGGGSVAMVTIGDVGAGGPNTAVTMSRRAMTDALGHDYAGFDIPVSYLGYCWRYSDYERRWARGDKIEQKAPMNPLMQQLNEREDDMVARFVARFRQLRDDAIKRDKEKQAKAEMMCLVNKPDPYIFTYGGDTWRYCALDRVWKRDRRGEHCRIVTRASIDAVMGHGRPTIPGIDGINKLRDEAAKKLALKRQCDPMGPSQAAEPEYVSPKAIVDDPAQWFKPPLSEYAPAVTATNPALILAATSPTILPKVDNKLKTPKVGEIVWSDNLGYAAVYTMTETGKIEDAVWSVCQNAHPFPVLVKVKTLAEAEERMRFYERTATGVAHALGVMRG